MKNALLIAAIACIGMVSCKKDYRCECENASVVGEKMEKRNFAINGANDRDAKRKCESFQATMRASHNVSTYECKVK